MIAGLFLTNLLWVTEQAEEAREKIQETQAKHEEFQETREHLNVASREAAAAIKRAKAAEAEEGKLATAIKNHEKTAAKEEQTAARVSAACRLSMFYCFASPRCLLSTWKHKNLGLQY